MDELFNNNNLIFEFLLNIYLYIYIYTSTDILFKVFIKLQLREQSRQFMNFTQTSNAISLGTNFNNFFGY